MDDLPDRMTTQIHIRLWLGQHDSLTVNHNLAELGLEAPFPARCARDPGKPVNHHEADIVPCLRVFPARVP
jgi:hypothetical protein